MSAPSIDHSSTERWLIYGSQLDKELSPVMTGLTILIVSLIVLVLVYVVREFNVLSRLRGKDKKTPDPVATELKLISKRLSQIQAIKDDVAANAVRISRLEDHLSKQDGRIDGAVDAMREIVADSARRERETLRELKSERERISSYLARIVPSGSG